MKNTAAIEHENQAFMHVLVVEDEKLMNWSLERFLTAWGFDVCPVFSGKEAVDTVQKSGFDVILLDYQLPDLNGLEVAKQIRQTQPHAWIVLITAFQLGELKLDDGLIDGYLNKPVDMQQLRQTLRCFAEMETDRPGATGIA